MKRTMLTLGIAALSYAGLSQDTYWTIDPAHTTIGFNATHLVISEVSGQFLDFSGTVSSLNDENFSNAEISLVVQTKSVDTENAERDKHLRSADFFNCEQFPTMTFKSTRVRKINGNEYKLYGELTLNGITKNVTLDLKHGGTIVDPIDGLTKAGFKVRGSINRYDFNLKWNIAQAAESFAVGEEIEIDCNVRLTLVNEELSTD